MNKVYLGIITVLASVCICVGQTEKGQGRSAVTFDSGTQITAELQKTIDVNNAKVGDQVTLKTTQSIRQNGEVVVPKGSNLIGRVTEVTRRTKNNAESRIGLIFDRIEGKQLSIPVNATIVSVTNAAASARVDDIAISDVSGSSTSSARTSRSTSGGGILGGVGSTVGGLANTTTQTVGIVTDTATQTVDATATMAGRTVRGLRISASASGSANSSTTLSSPNRNLRVEKGAMFDLRVAN